jgi:predicted nucleic acid-binding protein
MRTVFADTYYLLAGFNKLDEGYEKAVDFAKSFQGRVVTTEWILTEVGDAFAQFRKRSAFLEVLDRVEGDPQTLIVEASHELFLRGVELFRKREDKNWSLTDCISFAVMQREGIREALTADHHFTQAGFVALLA